MQTDLDLLIEYQNCGLGIASKKKGILPSFREKTSKKWRRKEPKKMPEKVLREKGQ